MPFKFGDKNITNIYKGETGIIKAYKGETLLFDADAGGGDVRGEEAYTTPGTYSWTAPAGVTSVSVVAIGGTSASGNIENNQSGVRSGQGGAGLGWKNNIPVVPGQSYTVQVGEAGTISNVFGSTNSFFINTATVAGLRGLGITGGGFSGDGGGNGGNGSFGFTGTNPWAGGGGGAGGYTGNGGAAGQTRGVSGNAGSGGGGGGGASTALGGVALGYGFNGGGVGIYGAGANGTAANFRDGFAGSGGNSTNPSTTPNTRLYGAGPRGLRRWSTSGFTNGTDGMQGAVRIVWGQGRAFPATDVGPT